MSPESNGVVHYLLLKAYLFIWLYWVLVVACELYLWHVESSSLTGVEPRPPSIETVESLAIGSPHYLLFQLISSVQSFFRS